MGLPNDREQLQYLFKIQRLLGEGSFTASYKFALLNALAEHLLQLDGEHRSRPGRIVQGDEPTALFTAVFLSQV